MRCDKGFDGPENYLWEQCDEICENDYLNSDYDNLEFECKVLRKILKQKIKYFPESKNAELLNSLYIDGYPIYGYCPAGEEPYFELSLGCLKITPGTTFSMQYKSVIGILLEIAGRTQIFIEADGDGGSPFFYNDIVPCIVNLPSPEDPVAEEIFNHLINFILTRAEEVHKYLSYRGPDPDSESELVVERLEEHAKNGKWGLTREREEPFSFEPCKVNTKNVVDKILGNYRYIKSEEIPEVIREMDIHEEWSPIKHTSGNFLETRHLESSDKVLYIEGFKTFYPVFKMKADKKEEILLSEIPRREFSRENQDPVGSFYLVILLASNLEYAPDVQWCNYREKLVELVNSVVSVHYPTYTAGRFYAHMVRFIAENLHKIDEMKVKPIETRRKKK